MASSNGQPGGLDFPGEESLGYAGFDYFAFDYFALVIDTLLQTADVAIASRPICRLGLVNCVLAFVFNTTVLALTINIAASLL